ncbi:hypothetical protein [Parvibaculum sp.]|mgnify:CR=1 FL=1|jgi:hypothetical protein|uniref:hypothetical protein n=1 Tax=Parvibaculum sp. TaxID=2024848 RepID=UPI002FD8DC6A
MLDLLHHERDDDEYAEEAQALQEAETRRSVMRMSFALVVAAALLLAFNSQSLVTWVNGFEVGPVQDTIVSLAARWNGQMEEQGLDTPAKTVRGEVNEARNMDWAEVERWLENEQARSREGARLLRGMLSEDRG